jgi:hypothetical protein
VSRTVRVVTAHVPRAGEPLKLRAGDEVRVGRRDEEFPAWTWCETDDGGSGWIPEAYVAREAPEFDRGSVLRDYDATELAAAPGDVLDVIDEEGGWLWCRSGDGAEGWVPARNVEPA